MSTHELKPRVANEKLFAAAQQCAAASAKPARQHRSKPFCTGFGRRKTFLSSPQLFGERFLDC